MIAAANFTYLIGICMPNIAAWLLRRDLPDAERPYRAPRGTIMLGVVAACIWLLVGHPRLPAVRPADGAVRPRPGLLRRRPLRVARDRGPAPAGLPPSPRRCTSSSPAPCCLVLVLDGIAYLLAVNTVADGHHELVAVLEDIFVVVALLTISVGLVLPGMITYSAKEVSKAAKRLTSGTLREFSLAMGALGRGDLEAAHASVNIVPVKPNSRDELGEMADSFNMLQEQVRDAALGLDEARENMRTARAELLRPPRADRPSRPSRPADRPAQPHALAAKLAETFERRQGARHELCRARPSTSITSRKPTTFSATASATSCFAPSRGGSSMPPAAPSSPASAATNSPSSWRPATSRRPPRLWPAACCRPSPSRSRCRGR